jgi:hypothetical protein
MTIIACVSPTRTHGPSTRHLEIDGQRVGPIFHSLTDPIGDAEELAHHWMESHHPGVGYSIVSSRNGHCFRRVNHPPQTVAKELDYSPW